MHDPARTRVVLLVLAAVNVAHAGFVGVLVVTGSEMTSAAVIAATLAAVTADVSLVVWAGRARRAGRGGGEEASGAVR